MAEKVRRRPTQLGCAPVPLATGRIPHKLPVLESAAAANNGDSTTLWYRANSSLIQPSGDILVNSQRRYSLDHFYSSHYRRNSERRLPPTSPTSFRKSSPNLASHLQENGLSVTSIKCVGKFNSKEGLWVRGVTRKTRNGRPHTAEDLFSKHSERPETAKSSDSSETVSESDADRSGSRGGLSRYTPLPAIASKSDDKQMQTDDYEIIRPSADDHCIRHSVSSLDDFWHSGGTNSSDRKLPPLRPIVRSRTFTIISPGEDQELCGADEDEPSSWEEEQRSGSDSGSNGSNVCEDEETLLHIIVKLPNGSELERYFDTDDTLETVLQHAVQVYNDSGLTDVDELTELRLVNEGVLLMDDSLTLGQAKIKSKTLLYLQHCTS